MVYAMKNHVAVFLALLIAIVMTDVVAIVLHFLYQSFPFEFSIFFTSLWLAVGLVLLILHSIFHLFKGVLKWRISQKILM